MALYDNKYWLLSHIRNSFISTDDTGMCELVMVGESKGVKEYLGNLESYPEPEESEDEEEDESYDLQLDMGFGIRERSNTAAQLEKLDKLRKIAADMRHVKWETSKETSENVADMFVRKDVTKNSKPLVKKSSLTILMENFSNLPQNPYMQFAKFDGSGQVNIPTRKYKIYLTMLPPEQRNYPLSVCCVASAKIHDLIGLILLNFSTNHGASNLEPVTSYGLCITEENGEVDRDFPCLDPKEGVSKFGFTSLGLVERTGTFKSVSFPDDNQLLFSIENPNRTRTTSEKSKADENRQIRNDLLAMDEHQRRMEAPLYQSFRVFMLNRVRPRVECNLGVSGERIEIDPVQQKSSKLIPFKARAVSHHMDTVAWCEAVEARQNRTVFRLVYSAREGGSPGDAALGFSGNASSFPPSMQTSASFKHYDFECDNVTAQNIVQKIKLILEVRSSTSRREYIAAKEKKLYKRKSFNIGK